MDDGRLAAREEMDSKELYFRRGPNLMVVKAPATSTAGGWPAPELLFTGNFVRDTAGDQSDDVARDGRFLLHRR
jgi:hypothetical protein